ncbi:MAG TPA: N-acyl homoserine lactonase family protein [Phenylobacterium sp.]|jgi:N-acyl homoserine lactone hydrolase|nr:N-acyl homoserine lactonase family protein [Phenylobacterium sp.]
MFSKSRLTRALRAFAIVAALQAMAGSALAAPNPAVKLYAIDCGHSVFTDAGVLADDGSLKGKPLEVVVPCFLIRHPKGDLIWDTGLPEIIARMPAGLTAGGVHTTVARTLTDQLADLGLKPQDIGYLSLSHSHVDHTGSVASFSKAVWIIDERERAYIAGGAAGPGLAKTLAAAQTRVIAGDEDADVFGDGSVTIIQAPGHTPGHAVLLVKLAHAGAVLISGDLWQTSEARKNRLVPTNNTDRAQTLVSMDKVEAVVRKTHARVIREHVLEDFKSLPAFPKPLD